MEACEFAGDLGGDADGIQLDERNDRHSVLESGSARGAVVDGQEESAAESASDEEGKLVVEEVGVFAAGFDASDGIDDL